MHLGICRRFERQYTVEKTNAGPSYNPFGLNKKNVIASTANFITTTDKTPVTYLYRHHVQLHSLANLGFHTSHVGSTVKWWAPFLI